ncbi:penicillin-binding protein 1A [Acinetobacter nectaris]|uniref:penicillin-binding protein 1A n=1 Tax=Acinetobacter nectaris TaxID=1219382 RepID=UPI001F01C751|nr:PBP1A family penicillin-binding protein [Acinetobacter nectaris]MCF8999026.1 PBP1A family penicillin-binding protein [Acinetobacter nectaris]MCF9027290.1 PBP1A family penicillin-binding protein [Acinetobacter nectaris]
MKNPYCSGRIYPLFLLILIIILAIPVGFYGMYLYIAPSLPDMSSIKKAPLLKPIQIYTSDNQLIGEYGGRLSVPVEYKQIPPQFIHAFLAAEDSSFFEHSGISLKGLGRAVSESISGSDVQTGGSTITMQVAKNYYLSPERTLKRKLTEVFLARKLEQNLSKEEILSLYVNKIFLGKNAYGIAAAAKIYYNKNLTQLSLAQMAMIAGLPKAPSKYNPVANPERALERRNWILGRMLQLGYINQHEYQIAVAEPLNLDMPDRGVTTQFPYIGELVRSEIVDRFGPQAVDAGFKIYTTINSKRQAYAEEAVQDGLEEYDRRHGWRGAEAHDQPLSQFSTYANAYPAKVLEVNQTTFVAELKDGKKVTIPWEGMVWAKPYHNANSVGPTPTKASQIVKVNDIVRLRPNTNQTIWSLVQIPKVQGQLIALNPNNGAVEAMVGGYSYYQSTFNRALQGWRQPGSTIKPFIYALALERGMTPNTMVDDDPITIGKWSPKNADGRFLGMIPLKTALYLSRNTVSVRLLQSVGIERARQLLMDFGLQENQIPRNYTIALGTPQVLPIQMATGYAAFANGGYRVEPFFIDHIDDAYGKTLYRANPDYACIPCINEDTAKKSGQVSSTPDDEAFLTHDKNTAVPKLKEADQNKSDYRQAQRIIKSSSAYDMANILHDVIQIGTGRAALSVGREDLGGKTGTTNDARDAWFSGFNGKLVTVTWVGFDQPTTLGKREYGGVAALPIWANFMKNALNGTPYSWVTFDKNAADPDLHITPQQRLSQSEDRTSPPMAHPIYRPTPPPKTNISNKDFGGLPEDSGLIPDDNESNNAANKEKTASPPKKDDLEQLINQVQ